MTLVRTALDGGSLFFQFDLPTCGGEPISKVKDCEASQDMICARERKSTRVTAREALSRRGARQGQPARGEE